MAYYDNISEGYDELYRDEQIEKINIIKSKIKIRKNSKLLDVGCGTGLSSAFGCFVVGIDPSIKLLQNNKNKMKIMGIAEYLPFKDSSFDYIISVTAMHNFDDSEKFIHEAKRSGKNNFVFSVLKKSKKFYKIKLIINQNFNVYEVVEEDKDTIFFCRKP
ncbi:MAG TPA: class I SAM-dependent methyltransferase [Candidatus Nanoarchaeia archaeon]|nr:class I SAM-dependent methyltransferase [Candidatus Nanoarchaeia archaeon]